MRKNTDSPYFGCGQITREQFLFHEMRIVSRLKSEGFADAEIIERIYEDNLFQYPTERMIRQMVKTCLKRLECLKDEALVRAIASQPVDVAKQICLYAMMKQYRVVWDFMVTVIGEKYRHQDMSFGRIDINAFFLRLQEQDDCIASWSEATVERIKLIIIKILIENEYLTNNRSERLNPVMISSLLEDAIRANGDHKALAAFNCLL